MTLRPSFYFYSLNRNKTAKAPSVMHSITKTNA